VRVGLLGELEVRDSDDQDVVVSGTKLRALLAVLALHAGRTVQTDQLVDVLWGDSPPPAVRNGLQGLASKLRRALGGADVVTMRGGGYALELDPAHVDVHRFERLVVAARDTDDAEQALTLLDEAEALWRGSALAEFAYDDFATATIARLDELRAAAREDRLDLQLQLGRHLALLPEAEALVAEQPLRERARGLLMTALYRAGRQADALRVFQDGRRILGDELGLDPGPELRQLEAAILAHDPSLDAPTQQSAVASRRLELPASPTPLVGRERELDDLAALIAEQRLVTLVGPGGVGKTRLALELARQAAADLEADGCLVELAPAGDGDAVRPAIARALDLPDPTRLAELLGDRTLVLVLDNCEHVIASAADVADELLRRCPNLRLIATSREGLRVGGETVWPVPPLAAADAAELFFARARAAGARLEPSNELDRAVEDICSRLDGLPLAIELAAARTRAFPVAQLAARLHDRFRVLTGGSRTALPRQQTLRAVVDWSYDLLFADEQRLFERLSAFPGGCDIATAREVCADDALLADDIDDLVEALIDKSLVVPVPHGDDLRLVQLQTLAQYGREKLAERGDAERVRTAMAAHFADLCRGSTLAYVGDIQRAWLTTMDVERANLRAALDWAVDTGDAETALTIAGGASWPHWLASTWVDGLRWIEDALGCVGEASDAARAIALTGRGLLRFQNGMRDGVDDDLEAALDLLRGGDDVGAVAMAYSFWAEIASVQGDTGTARTRRRESLAFYSMLGESETVRGMRAYGAGKLAALDGDLDEAETRYREALSWFERVDRPVMTAMTMSMVADFDERAGRYAEASDLLRRAIDLGDAVAMRGFSGTQLGRLAWALLQAGDVQQAAAIYDRVLDAGRRLRNARMELLALAGIAALHRIAGRVGDAAVAARQALDLHVASGPARLSNRVVPGAETASVLGLCCTILAADASERGRHDEAARFLGAADSQRATAGLPVPWFQVHDDAAARATALDALGDDAFAKAYEAGRTGDIAAEVALHT
jgi:predicted ATPase